MHTTIASISPSLAGFSHPDRVYRGRRLVCGTLVTVDTGTGLRSLPLRLDLRSHSPTGFEWGFAGSGPAQLALALLAYELRADDEALGLYQQFKLRIVAGLPHRGWTLTSAEIRGVLEHLSAGTARHVCRGRA